MRAWLRVLYRWAWFVFAAAVTFLFAPPLGWWAIAGGTAASLVFLLDALGLVDRFHRRVRALHAGTTDGSGGK